MEWRDFHDADTPARIYERIQKESPWAADSLVDNLDSALKQLGRAGGDQSQSE
jgi:hypothetical protein